jgi:hypothetical protein
LIATAALRLFSVFSLGRFQVIVVTLLEAGADADLVNESGCTALSLAQEKRCHEVVNILIAPPLHYAAKVRALHPNSDFCTFKLL